jgi:hypothetical protein
MPCSANCYQRRHAQSYRCNLPDGQYVVLIACAIARPYGSSSIGEIASAATRPVNSTPTSLPRRQMILHCFGGWPNLDRCRLNCLGRLSISPGMSLAPFPEMSTSLHRSRRELLSTSIQAGRLAVRRDACRFWNMGFHRKTSPTKFHAIKQPHIPGV